jgi:L-histidine Nalpha-methyltransferase
MIARALVTLPAYTDEVVNGLTSARKTLPCKLFYDDRGSALFEEITRMPEYYLTRTELEILQDKSHEIAHAIGLPVSIIELGAGTATKTGTLLGAFARRQMRLKYYPVDISPAALDDAKNRIKLDCPSAVVKPVVADFAHGFAFLKNIPNRKLVLYLGSSIGNFDWNDAVSMLKSVREQLAAGDTLLLGTDMVKPAKFLVPAYDDGQGITAEFDKNILMRLNREFGGDFDLSSFRHIAEWNPSASRMEIYLESMRSQAVSLKTLGLSLGFRKGERIHTENSYKYSLQMVEQMLCVSGFKLARSWFDRREWFGLHLARA